MNAAASCLQRPELKMRSAHSVIGSNGSVYLVTFKVGAAH
jgi:hypothetical protein